LVRFTLAVLLFATPALAEPIDPARLFPVIREAELDGFRGVDLADRAVAPGLKAFLVIDDGTQVQFLLPEDVVQSGLTDDAAWARALANRIGRGTPRLVDVAPGVTSLEQDAANESSFLLDHDRWARQASTMGRLVAAVPNRQVLVFGDAAVPGVAAEMAAIVRYAEQSLDNPLSPGILEWTGTGWVPFRP
jgi:hypothetical protein